jgi:hypothetical protein
MKYTINVIMSNFQIFKFKKNKIDPLTILIESKTWMGGFFALMGP